MWFKIKKHSMSFDEIKALHLKQKQIHLNCMIKSSIVVGPLDIGLIIFHVHKTNVKLIVYLL